MEEYNPTPPRKTRTDQSKNQTTGSPKTDQLMKRYIYLLNTFGRILFNNLNLIIPGMQSAICVTVSQVNCSFFEVWGQEKGCFHAQRIKYMLLAVYDQSVGHEFVPSYTSITPKFALIPFPQGIRQRQNSSHRRLVFIK